MAAPWSVTGPDLAAAGREKSEASHASKPGGGGGVVL